MYLVLCDSSDLAALWAWRELSRRLAGVRLVTSEALVYAARWEHRVDSYRTSTTITLGDGRVIRSEEVRGTLNRLLVLPGDHLRAVAADREYAGAELLAFFASWLHALPKPVLNPASPAGLSGGAQWRDHSEWLWLAVESGLDVPPYVENESTLWSAGTAVTAFTPGHEARSLPLAKSQSGDCGHRTPNRLMVIGDRVVGPPHPEHVASGCIALARRTNLGILGIGFDEGWSFRHATVVPDLREGGSDAIDALAEALT